MYGAQFGSLKKQLSEQFFGDFLKSPYKELRRQKVSIQSLDQARGMSAQIPYE